MTLGEVTNDDKIDASVLEGTGVINGDLKENAP
jgi:hypothetical protein